MPPVFPAHGKPRPQRAARVLIPLLALAVLAACTGGPGVSPADDRPPAAPEPLTPRGAGPAPESFTWKQVPGDWVYRVIVTDAAERPLYQQDRRNEPSIPFPNELKEMMAEPHATFSWSVAIVAPDGRHLAQSPPVRFWLRQP